MNAILVPTARGRRRPRRRGTALYVIVLSTALITSLLGLAALAVVRIERRQASTSNHLLDARMNARAAVELALRVIANDPNWRTTHTNGAETTPQSPGPGATGTVSWILEDSDGDLSNEDADLRLKGVGRVGNVVQVSSVKLEKSAVSLDVLERTTYSAQNVTVVDQVWTSGGPISTPAALTLNNTLNGDAEAGSVTNGGSVTGTLTTPFDPLTMPQATVFDTYVAMATAIDFYSLDSGKIEKQVVSAQSNPFGTPNSEGIYYIEVPPSETLHICNSRIVGTFVVSLNSDASMQLDQAILWQRPVGNYPMLIVKGTTGSTLDFRGYPAGILSEFSLLTNFNPPGTPYGGASDSDTFDMYLTEFNGLIHVIGSSVEVSLDTGFALHGSLISEGPLTLKAGYTAILDPQLFANPPVGYTGLSDDPEPVMGTWLWDAAP